MVGIGRYTNLACSLPYTRTRPSQVPSTPSRAWDEPSASHGAPRVAAPSLVDARGGKRWSRDNEIDERASYGIERTRARNKRENH